MTETLKRGYPGMKVMKTETDPSDDTGQCGLNVLLPRSCCSLHCIYLPAFHSFHASSSLSVLMEKHSSSVLLPCSVCVGWSHVLDLQSVKDMPIVQDMPPVGGFPSIRIQRQLPSTGPTGIAIFTVGAAVMAYGYYNVSSCSTSSGQVQSQNMPMGHFSAIEGHTLWGLFVTYCGITVLDRIVSNQQTGPTAPHHLFPVPLVGLLNNDLIMAAVF